MPAKNISQSTKMLEQVRESKRKGIDAILTTEQMRAVRDFVTDNDQVATCRDIFMLSYYLGGMKGTQLFSIDFNDSRDTIRGRKAGIFSIPDEARAIIDKYIGGDGRLDISKHIKRKNTPDLFIDRLSVISKQAGIPTLLFSSARQSFRAHATQLGIDRHIVEYLLGAPSCANATTPAIATKALRLVLDNLKGDTTATAKANADPELMRTSKTEARSSARQRQIARLEKQAQRIQLQAAKNYGLKRGAIVFSLISNGQNIQSAHQTFDNELAMRHQQSQHQLAAIRNELAALKHS